MDKQAFDEAQIQTVDGYELWITPSTHVVDSMEALMDADSEPYKRLHPSIDSGFIYVSGTYTGESVRRKKEGEQWVDTNHSGLDFYVTEPISDCSAE